MGITCIKDHRPEHSMGDDRWHNGCAQCEIERLRTAVATAAREEREAIIASIPGGCSVDPQWVCDMIRERNGT